MSHELIEQIELISQLSSKITTGARKAKADV